MYHGSTLAPVLMLSSRISAATNIMQVCDTMHVHMPVRRTQPTLSYIPMLGMNDWAGSEIYKAAGKMNYRFVSNLWLYAYIHIYVWT
jgi:hypothetical protein